LTHQYLHSINWPELSHIWRTAREHDTIPILHWFSELPCPWHQTRYISRS
jgi:hypothetical protein